MVIQNRITDTATGAAIVLTSLSLLEVLHITGAVLGIVCGAFSLYFHIRRALKERKR
ncbi:MAG: hypothetical protein WD795_16380 [Woeseia sp.]